MPGSLGGLTAFHVRLQQPRSGFILDKPVENAKTLTMECKDRCRPEGDIKPATVCELKGRFLRFTSAPAGSVISVLAFHGKTVAFS